MITTVVGSGSAGFSGDGRPALKASVDGPAGIAFDRDGNLYFADSNNNRVRRGDLAGTITTIAGTGDGSSFGNGGPAAKASLADPESIAIDTAGTLYVGEADGNVVRRVSPDGAISAFAGTGAPGYTGDGGQAVDARLNVQGSTVGLAIGENGTGLHRGCGQRLHPRRGRCRRDHHLSLTLRPREATACAPSLRGAPG